jgi:hypothetical protein
VNQPEPNAGRDREIAARGRPGQTCESIAIGFGITRATGGLAARTSSQVDDTSETWPPNR